MFYVFNYDGRVRCTSVVDAWAVGIMINLQFAHAQVLCGVEHCVGNVFGVNGVIF